MFQKSHNTNKNPLLTTTSVVMKNNLQIEQYNIEHTFYIGNNACMHNIIE